jgi:hypothetical protein
MVTTPTRVAGWGSGAFGSMVTWTVAEGRAGRRWREVVSQGGTVLHALLLETDPDGRFSHLELARADGLWTFHPEPDGTLHGNRVGGAKPDVRHVAGWPFVPDDALVVDGSPISLAAIAWRWARSLAPGKVASAETAGVLIRPGSELVRVPGLRIERLSAKRWRVGEGSPFEIDGAGLPVLIDGTIRPLELD